MWWFRKCLIITIILVGAKASIYDIRLKNLLTLQHGLGFPSSLMVADGQEALMRLAIKLPNQQKCMVTTPAGKTFDVASPSDQRYQHWSDGCGVRVRKVTQADEGRWRLTASKGKESITGWIVVTVIKTTKNYLAPPISLRDGETQTDVELASLDNAYCLVAQPFSESSLVPGHCQVTLDKTTRAVQGNWNVLIGLPGQVSEVRVQRQVAVEAERLDVGYTHDAILNKIHLYCNILHTSKNVTFCRFQKTTDSVGYNVMEGLSDGAHSYYGNGFVAKECGMTIEHPTGNDLGTWRCSVGSVQWVGNTLQQQTPMQALINVVSNTMSKRSRRDVPDEIEEERNVFVQAGQSFTLTCRAQTSLSYCWFLHPNGSQFSPVPQANEHQRFWYTGQSLQSGDCGITFDEADDSDAGGWECHMGVANKLGVEYSDRINVRVTGPLAANKKEQTVSFGDNATLFCHTANGNRPLDYCRFVTPNYVGINIDSSITYANAILDRFYFLPNRNLDYGDCSLVIKSVEPEDIGTWTCAARINGENQESSDTMELQLVSETPRAPLSKAGIAGMSVGVFALIVVLFGVVWHQIGRPVPWKWSRKEATPSVVAFELMSVGRTSNVSSESSGSEVDLHVRNGGSTPQRVEAINVNN